MLWVKAFHQIFMVAWFAGLFYLPRLFVYHAECPDEPGRERFKIMERRLYRSIMLPAAVVTVGLGIWLLGDYAWKAYGDELWLHLKLFLALLLIGYHLLLGHWLKAFAEDRNQRGPKFFRIVNEIPTVFLIFMVILAVVKPEF